MKMEQMVEIAPKRFYYTRDKIAAKALALYEEAVAKKQIKSGDLL